MPAASSRASDETLPISRVMSSASSDCLLARRLHAPLSKLIRSLSAVAAHAGCAARAAAIVAETWAWVVHFTRPITSPVAGFVSTRHPSSMSTPCTMSRPKSVGGEKYCFPFSIFVPPDNKSCY